MIRIVVHDLVAHDCKGIDGALMAICTLTKLQSGDDHATTPTHVTLNSIPFIKLFNGEISPRGKMGLGESK